MNLYYPKSDVCIAFLISKTLIDTKRSFFLKLSFKTTVCQITLYILLKYCLCIWEKLSKLIQDSPVALFLWEKQLSGGCQHITWRLKEVYYHQLIQSQQKHRGNLSGQFVAVRNILLCWRSLPKHGNKIQKSFPKYIHFKWPIKFQKFYAIIPINVKLVFHNF